MLGTRNYRIIAAVLVGIGTVAAGAAFGAGESAAKSIGAVTVTIEPVRPYQRGDLVWTTTPPVPEQQLGALDTGCDRVPATGYISTNVYADSGAHYANFWSWGQGSSGQAYYWYVKRTDGTTQTSGHTSGADNSTVPANVYRWKVQNKGASPQAWNVCFDVN